MHRGETPLSQFGFVLSYGKFVWYKTSPTWNYILLTVNKISFAALKLSLFLGLSQPEVELRQRTANGTFTTAMAISMLPPNLLDLGVCTLDSSNRVVHLQITNPGTHSAMECQSRLPKHPQYVIIFSKQKPENLAN